MPIINDKIRYPILKLLQDNPQVSQRQLAQTLGISLGKANYCLKALIDVGLVKVNNFKCSKNKTTYAYLLTPKGIDEKARVTLRFLRSKQKEYDLLMQEIEELRQEVLQTELQPERE